MKNFYNISNEHIQYENNIIYHVNDLSDVDISGISNRFTSLNYKVLGDSNQSYFIDPAEIIENFPGLLKSNKIPKTESISYSQLIPSSNGLYQIEFMTTSVVPNINDQIIITIERSGENTMSFAAKVV